METFEDFDLPSEHEAMLIRLDKIIELLERPYGMEDEEEEPERYLDGSLVE